MSVMKGPAIFLAQFLPPSDQQVTLAERCEWAASLGYRGIQLPTWDARLFDLERASASQVYCDEILET